MEQHWFDVGLSVGSVFLTMAFTWMSTCISSSIQRTKETGMKVTLLECQVKTLCKDLEEMKDTLQDVAKEMGKWVVR